MYFHFAPLLLEPGSQIKAGNFGRNVRLYTARHGNHYTLIREIILENERQKNHPDKPSRLSSIFLFEEENPTKQYRAIANKHTEILYKVKLVDTDCKRHKADWRSFDPASDPNRPPPLWEFFENQAKTYWVADPEPEFTEVIAQSDIIIEEEVFKPKSMF